MAISVDEYRKLQEKCNREYTRVKHDEPEYRLQCQCVRWFYENYPDHYIVASANGGKRDKVTACKMMKSGVKAGEPDLKIGVARKGFHHLYIELKNGKKGKLSEEQKRMIDYYKQQGCRVEVVRSFEEFVELVSEYMN